MILGRRLKLAISGESHAPQIGMRLEGLPAGFTFDKKELQAFVDRRAPGKDKYSTARREPDKVEFVREEDGLVEAVIRNVDTRSGDYEKTVPRPGHADFPSYFISGRIPPGGGAHSGRMTAPMCIAGGICLQLLAKQGIKVSARLVRCGGQPPSKAKRVISAARAEGDSVGGVVECTVEGLPAGVGGPMFDGLDGAVSQAIFGIPGVKGIEFGEGFHAADLKGSENNDAFAVEKGRVVTKTNRHGGVLGGFSSGMPLVFRVAFKPTPSIYKPQQSVDLRTMKPVTLQIRGRHDPCIALRAIPVVEAMAGFAVLDSVLCSCACGFSGSTAVVDGTSCLAKLPHIVIDGNVAKLYPSLARKAILVIPSGEKHKSIQTVMKIWKAFAKAGLTRKDRVTAIGGGVTNDLVGFAAATWMRGIEWYSVPTTLLSMVDASFGGKTGFDLPEGKNLAGAFHSPRTIYLCRRFLRTLPAKELACGRAEMIKHEVIGALPHESDPSGIPSMDELLANRRVKCDIVAKDPYERTGERAKLNLGHTIAHAVEKKSNYRISHGEAVAIGTVEEARLAERTGLAPAGLADELARRFAAAGLPTRYPKGMDFESLKPLMKHDKKNESGKIVFALPCGWGDVRIVKL